MKARFIKQAQHEYSPRQRLVALLFEAIFFVILIPAGLAAASTPLDRWLGLPRLGIGILHSAVVSTSATLVGLLLILIGWPLALWAIFIQFTEGRGTPVPLMATQKLITDGPYAYCRNPMALGAILAYVGVSLCLGSLAAVGLVLALSTVLLMYIRRAEENEMEARFGPAYLAYRQRTPFLIPRRRR